ncbi:hypothetical protein [Sporosarcina globispora]|uniref:hypothetical protein n=1 Tax=Sporosarcina globispora TaxID=1459 RepID=UPI000A940624|nr:hypothetical protein [Sporosarcina globispora]
MDVAEIKVVAVGKVFDKNLPVKGTLIFEFPDGSKKELDVLDIIETDWYDEIA